jgi:hypothetical protein
LSIWSRQRWKATSVKSPASYPSTPDGVWSGDVIPQLHHLVASPRPRVGKTLLARLLADFHLHEGRSVAAFDLNVGERTLAQFLSEKTTVATIRDINGQMVLFDRLVADEDITKVIDLGHESFESFFSVAHQIGFVEEARRRSVAVAILFTVTPDDSDVSAQRNVRTRAASRQVSAGQWKFGDGASTVLAPGLRRYIEMPPFSFADSNIGNAVGIPFNAHIELQRWLRRIYLEFRELDLRILLADLQASIPPHS